MSFLRARRFIAGVGLALFAAAAQPASAKVITLDATVDLTKALYNEHGFMAGEYYGSLAAHGTTEPYRTRMLDFDGLNDLIGTPEMIALGKRFEGPGASAGKNTGARR